MGIDLAQLTVCSAIQSEYVSVVVDGPLREYRLPRDILQHSTKLSDRFPSRDTTSLILRQLPQAKFKIFFDWCHQRRLDDDLSLPSAMAAVEFALEFDVPILLNQLADRFRQEILNGRWTLDLDTTRWAYTTIPVDTKVHCLFALSLYSIPLALDPSNKRRDNKRKLIAAGEWRDLCRKLPELGADFAALRFGPDAKTRLQEAGSCDFHNRCPSGDQRCLTFGSLRRTRKSAESSIHTDSKRRNKCRPSPVRTEVEEVAVEPDPEQAMEPPAEEIPEPEMEVLAEEAAVEPDQEPEMQALADEELAPEVEAQFSFGEVPEPEPVEVPTEEDLVEVQPAEDVFWKPYRRNKVR